MVKYLILFTVIWFKNNGTKVADTLQNQVFSKETKKV